MDDFALFADDKAELRERLLDVRAFLEGRLRLELKDSATRLAPASEGLPFLGWRVFPGVTRIRRENLRRSLGRLARRERAFGARWIGANELAASARSIFEHLRQGSTLFLRRGVCTQDRGALEDPVERAPCPA